MVESLFQTVVTPKEFTVPADKGRRAKDIERLGLLGLSSQLKFDIRLPRARQRAGNIVGARTLEAVAQYVFIRDRFASGKFSVKTQLL